MDEVDRAVVQNCYSTRPVESRKHNFGYVAVVGGSKLYVSAPVLVGLSALRAGADISYLIVPRKSFWAAINYPDLVPINLGTEYVSTVTEDAWLTLERSDALVTGNGMTRGEEVKRTLNEILGEYRKPVVLDADALHFLDELEMSSEDVIITPHINEFRAITQESPKTLEEKIKHCQELSQETGFTVLLKGSTDVIACGDKLALNKTGNPYMTKGGTGDMLAGICGALMARGIDSFKAAGCAAYVSGLAGEMASKNQGEGLLATDVIRTIPRAIKASI